MLERISKALAVEVQPVGQSLGSDASPMMCSDEGGQRRLSDSGPPVQEDGVGALGDHRSIDRAEQRHRHAARCYVEDS
jgi:hypothetical protein